MGGYPEPRDYKNIHEFMDKHCTEISKGIIEPDCMMEACDYLLEMATSDLRSATSQLRRLYIHLLKYKFQPNKQTRSWINTIRNASMELDEALCNKALANKIDSDCQEIVYNNARKTAIGETGLNSSIFPKEILDEFKLDDIRDASYIRKYLIKYAYSDDALKELSV